MKNIKRIIASLLAIMCIGMTACSSKTSEASTGSSGSHSGNSHAAISPAPSADEYDGAGYDIAPSTTNAGIYNAKNDNAYGAAECCPEYDYPYYEGGETYTKFEQNGYFNTKDNSISTFSADVDTASYSNVRRMIQDGYVDPSAVRVEEMVNYFDYDYKAPKAGEPFSVNAEIASCPWNKEAQLLMIGLQAEDIDTSDIGPQNIVFLIDVSGSMSDSDKLPLVQSAFLMLTENLTENDRISIVTYAGTDAVVLDGVRGDKTEVISEAIEGLMAGGSTAGSDGIITAYELAEEHFIKGGNNRIILATDGDLNVGITDNDELEKLIEKKKESGVFLSVLGFGTGNIKDDKMELLADKGNGNYYYIDSILEAKKVLVEEMGGTLVTIAKDVKLQLEFNPDTVKSYRLVGYENRLLSEEDFNDDTKDAGEIGAGHRVTVLYEIIPQGKSDKSSDVAKLAIRYKEPDESESKLLEYVLGENCYKSSPSENIRFAACVAEFGLMIRQDEYAETSYESIIGELETLRCVKTDPYKNEFLDLVKQASEYMYWY